MNEHINKIFKLSTLNNNLLDKPLTVIYLGADLSQRPHLVGICSKLNESDLRDLKRKSDYTTDRPFLLRWFSRSSHALKFFNVEKFCLYDYYLWLSDVDFDLLEEVSELDEFVYTINQELNEK